MVSILHLLSNDNFIAVNKSIAGEVGLEAAVVLGELASEYNYWQRIGKLEDGYFYSTIENLETKTYLSGHNQRQALTKLQEKGWISITKKGLPAKRYIKVNENNLLMFFNDLSLKNLTTGDSNIEQQDIKNFDENKNISKENIEEKKEDINPLIPPHEQVISKEQIELDSMFKLFWTAYPKKVDRKGCERKFVRIKNLKEIFPDIMQALETQKRSKQWNEENGKYIPHPSTWINQERWNIVNEADEKQARIDEIAAENIDFFLN